GEQRAHGPVDEAAGEHGVQAGPALAAHEAAGNAAHGVELLVEVNGEGEVVDAVARAGGGGDGNEDAGLAVLHEYGGVGELSEPADLHTEGPAAVVYLVDLLVRESFRTDYHSVCSFRIFGGACPLALEAGSEARACLQI